MSSSITVSCNALDTNFPGENDNVRSEWLVEQISRELDIHLSRLKFIPVKGKDLSTGDAPINSESDIYASPPKPVPVKAQVLLTGDDPALYKIAALEAYLGMRRELTGFAVTSPPHKIVDGQAQRAYVVVKHGTSPVRFYDQMGKELAGLKVSPTRLDRRAVNVR
jgi:hypothetical protein